MKELKLKIEFDLYWMVIFLLIMSACSKNTVDNIQKFDLEKIANKNLIVNYSSTSDEFNHPVLEVSPNEENQGIVIWEKGDSQDWSKGKFLVLEIYGNNDFSGKIDIEFFSEIEPEKIKEIALQGGEISGTGKDAPRVSCLIGILPRLKTKVVFPLSYLDAQQIFIPRSPRQLKGTLNGNRLAPEDMSKVVLRFGPYYNPNYIPKFEIVSISITQDEPEPYPPTDITLVDPLGQQKLKDWPGKVSDEGDLVNNNQKLAKEVENVAFPKEWSKYGGWKEKQFNATGFFRTQHDGKRWWLVDPEGYAFLSVGVDCMRLGSTGPVNGIKDLFDWLPEASDKKFSEVIDKTGDWEIMDFYSANLIRSFGKDWRGKWSSVSVGLMKKFRFNTVGNWSDIDFARENDVPYVLPLRDFPSTEILLYRDFPDVFSKEYEDRSKEFAAQLVDFKDDQYLVGYFLRNEPQWAFGYHNLAFEMFGTDQQSMTKNEFVKWIGNKYSDDIVAFNQAWKLNLSNFENIKSLTFKKCSSEKARSDFYNFSTIMVKKYVDIPCDEVEKIDNNHLNLGMRYAWLSSDLLYKAGERFDVFSINGYGIDPPPTEEISKISGKPVMIGEFHHGAIDRGLPATGIVGVLNQEDRGNAYRNYIEQGFARPELVGMHYFQWIDQPFCGRFDGENYNIGVITVTNLPYPELTNSMTIANERIYKVGGGLQEPYKSEIIKTPPIHY